jgi:hypothetical protein
VDERPVDATAAVTAHRLLNSMAIISGAAATLREAADQLDVARRDVLLGMILDQAQLVNDTLGELVRGLPPGVLKELDGSTPPP